MSEHRRHLAWKAGEKARHVEKPISANDRPRGTIFHDDWHDGWNHADNALAKDQADV